MPKALHIPLGNTEIREPLIGALVNLRESGKHTSDEVLLNSTGPVTDLSRKSLLPSLGSVRILLIEPEVSEDNSGTAALDGEVRISNPNPLQLLVQEAVEGRWKTVEEHHPATLSEALKVAEKLEITPNFDESMPIVPGGFTGILGYDLSRWTVPVPLSNNPLPGTILGILWRADAWMVHERETNHLSIVALEGHQWCTDPPIPEKVELSSNNESPGVVPESESDSDHARKVSTIRKSITQGNLYQVNYGRRWRREMPGSPWDAFLRLTDSNPAPFSSWMKVGDLGWAVASSSPERLIEVEGGIVRTRPIKGTRKRGRDDQTDSKLRHQLASSEKEVAEHLMLVDLERHDLSRVCEPGSVRWSGWRVEALANVQHLVSGVEGRISESVSIGHAVSAMFPGGSITGCPKTVTVAAINELEEEPRGAWTGSMGYIHNGAGIADWNILIRTLEAHSGPNEWYGTVQAGGGIVIDSSPSEEVEEARWKAAALTEAAWGFRTGFSNDDLPDREVEIIPIPHVEGPIGEISPRTMHGNGSTGTILRNTEGAPKGATLLVDNLDSFTENIAQEIAILGSDVVIVEGRPEIHEDPSEKIDEWLDGLDPSRIVLGPGPARPEASPITMEIATRAISGNLSRDSKNIPLLGLCLGHQALGRAAGWELIESPLGAIHGKPSITTNDGTGLYSNLQSEIVMMRYNSLVLVPSDGDLIPNSWDKTGSLLMGLRHRKLPVHGIQFHPESVGSPMGREVLSSFLQMPKTDIEPNLHLERLEP
ncbi:MAG: hypothetical protein CMB46_01355 [Euryarchaeota archaeon]|nr:hypothetical protein [Euryarchaeota archaeon]